ncbi:MAG: nucleotidyltransferase domain-containing protein [Bermanella sp.]
MDNPESKFDQISQLLSQHFNDLKLAYVFGSQASGQATPDSDWDIAIFPAQSISNETRWEVAQAIASQLNTDVDLIDLREASTVLQMQVISNGELIIGQQNEADIFETKVYSMYASLLESHKAIVNVFVDTLKNG